MLTVAQAITEATATLQGISDSAKLDAELLLMQVLQQPRTYLYTHAGHSLTELQQQQYSALINRRQQGEPVAYILGYRDFWTLRLKVNEHTLIPRPDTEHLVQAVLDRVPPPSRGTSSSRGLTAGSIPGGYNLDPAVKPRDDGSTKPRDDGAIREGDVVKILELGTGTGAIALALAAERPEWQITATDISGEAIKVAEQNRALNHIAKEQVQFMLGDWFAALTTSGTAKQSAQQFAAIVSNPPYIADASPYLAQGDVRFEPATALTSGADGLDDLRILIKQAPQWLQEGGLLAFEHGYDQGEAIRALLSSSGFEAVETLRDYAGHERVSLGYFRARSCSSTC